jgi:hypothetical protein
MASKALGDIATALGLRQRTSTGIAYGELDGFPAQLALVQRGNYKQLVAILRFNAPGRDVDLRQRLDESPDLAATGLKRKLVSSDADSVTITIPPRAFTGLPRPQVVAARIRAVLDVLKAAVPDNQKVCRECGAAGAEPAILRGKVDRVCGNCAERLEQEAREVKSAYVARTANLPLGLVTSLVAGAAGAAVYGGIMIATDKMYWVVAIFTGVAVGWAAVKGSGKASAAVQAMAALVTVVSVQAGLLMFIGYVIDRDVRAAGDTVNWVLFVKAAPRLLWNSGSDALFSLVGGLFGALTAIKKAKPPDFTLVEKAPEAGIQG